MHVRHARDDVYICRTMASSLAKELVSEAFTPRWTEGLWPAVSSGSPPHQESARTHELQAKLEMLRTDSCSALFGRPLEMLVLLCPITKTKRLGQFLEI